MWFVNSNESERRANAIKSDAARRQVVESMAMTMSSGEDNIDCVMTQTGRLVNVAPRSLNHAEYPNIRTGSPGAGRL